MVDICMEGANCAIFSQFGVFDWKLFFTSLLVGHSLLCSHGRTWPYYAQNTRLPTMTFLQKYAVHFILPIYSNKLTNPYIIHLQLQKLTPDDLNYRRNG